MSKKYNTVEEMQDYISRLESSLKSYEDEYYNIEQSINGCKSEINSIQLLQQNMKDDNFQKWQQLPNLETQVEEVQREEPTIDDIIGGVDIRWQHNKG